MPAAKAKKLIIVESPHKATIIQKFLGPSFKTMASMGHVRDLPKKGRGKNALGIDVDNGYVMHYEPIKGKEKKIDELKEAAAKASEVYLAPDPDREGEAIAWHLKEALELPDDKIKRVTYRSVTKKAVLEAMEQPRAIDMDLVNAQQARRALDRLVGFTLSPFLWKKVAKSLSAGRVQSPAVKILAEREAEISAFKSEEYWTIKVKLEGDEKRLFEADLTKWNDKKFALGNPDASSKESADAIVARLERAPYKVVSVETKEVKSGPNPPFITSSMQQVASSNLRYGASKTMRVAQKLYEGHEVDGVATGLITYMRTDSVRIDPQAIEEARDLIKSAYGDDYLPAKANVYASSKNSQDAHEAIRPVVIELTPEKLKNVLDNDEWRLYDLIWRRFMQSQMSDARFSNTLVKIEADAALLEARGRVPLFDGYLKLSKSDPDDTTLLPKLSENEALSMQTLLPEQHFTRPPARYSEAGLIRALEKEGIGRPSTYAPIIQTIVERGYVILKDRSFIPTELGLAVNGILADNFKNIMDLKFTAHMESDLDDVETGKIDWISLLDNFYKPFKAGVDDALINAEPLKGRAWTGEEKCPLCGSNLTIRYSKSGAFLGCEKYPECKGLIPMPGQQGDASEDDAPVLVGVPTDCPECGSPMILKKSRFGKNFYACTRYPECKTTLSADKEGKPVILPKTDKICDKCGKPMVVKMSRRGPFLACSGYPECKNALSLDAKGEPETPPEVPPTNCEKCGKPMAVKKGPRGWFLACTGYPKCRNAKPIKDEKKDEEAN